jgi:NADH-quinone oxidoreductase subunit E
MEKIDLDVTLSPEEITEIDHLLSHYPFPGGATIDALKIVQKHRGWVSDGALKALAKHTTIPLADLDSVATFYNQIFRKPVGEILVHPCNGVSCALMGYKEVHQELKNTLGITDGQTTADGKYTLISYPCLAACDKAPAMIIDGKLHEKVCKSQVKDLLQQHQTRSED